MGYILINFDCLTLEQGDRVEKRFGEFIQILRKEEGLSKESMSAWCSIYVPRSGEDCSDLVEVTEIYD